MKVLVIRFGRVGDMLVVTPALRALRRAYPTGRIDVLTTETGAATLATNRHADSLHVLRLRRVPAVINPERARLLRQLRRTGYDTIFLFETAERYRRLAHAARPRRIYTFARANEEPDADHARRGGKHEAEHFADVLALAGVAMDGMHCEYPIGESAHARAAALLAARGVAPQQRVAGVHAGHFVRRRRHAPHPKEWPVERYAEVIRGLGERGFDHIVLTGSAGERDLNARIRSRAPRAATIDIAGETDLETLAAVIARCALFIAPDTGPAHLAAAVGTPLVALFGPKSPGIMGPLGDEARIRRLYPEPAQEPARNRRGFHARMWAITPAAVLAAADALTPGET